MVSTFSAGAAGRMESVTEMGKVEGTPSEHADFEPLTGHPCGDATCGRSSGRVWSSGPRHPSGLQPRGDMFKAQAWVSAPGHRCGCGGEGAGTEPGSQNVRRRGSLTPESSQPGGRRNGRALALERREGSVSRREGRLCPLLLREWVDEDKEVTTGFSSAITDRPPQ